MRPQCAKAKGRRLQQYVARKLVAAFPDILVADDIHSTSMGAGGEDVRMSPLAQRHIPFIFECKNVEALSLWAAVSQAKAHNRQNSTRTPVVVFTRNREETWICIPHEKCDLLSELCTTHDHTNKRNSIWSLIGMHQNKKKRVHNPFAILISHVDHGIYIVCHFDTWVSAMATRNYAQDAGKAAD